MKKAKKPKKAKKENLTDYPVPVRLPRELYERVRALVPHYGNQSTVVRVALLEGVKILERRHAAK